MQYYVWLINRDTKTRKIKLIVPLYLITIISINIIPSDRQNQSFVIAQISITICSTSQSHDSINLFPIKYILLTNIKEKLQIKIIEISYKNTFKMKDQLRNYYKFPPAVRVDKSKDNMRKSCQNNQARYSTLSNNPLYVHVSSPTTKYQFSYGSTIKQQPYPNQYITFLPTIHQSKAKNEQISNRQSYKQQDFQQKNLQTYTQQQKSSLQNKNSSQKTNLTDQLQKQQKQNIKKLSELDKDTTNECKDCDCKIM